MKSDERSESTSRLMMTCLCRHVHPIVQTKGGTGALSYDCWSTWYAAPESDACGISSALGSGRARGIMEPAASSVASKDGQDRREARDVSKVRGTLVTRGHF